MNIFEDLYSKKITIEEAMSYLKLAGEAKEEFKKGYEKFNKNSPEEFLTQIFTHIMLKDSCFQKEFLKTVGIKNFESNFDFTAEKKFEGSQREIDIFAETHDTILIIENKIGDRIKSKQPDTYAELYNEKFPEDKKQKHLIVLAKFSDLMPESDWNGEECINEHLKGKLQYICEPYNFESYYIYWYEVYDLLVEHFSNGKIKIDLLEFLRHQNLNQKWCRDIGSPDWRKRLIEAYNGFADKNSIEKLSEKSCGYKLGPLGNDKICFIGSRVQGARSAEMAAKKDKNDELCCFLKLEIKNKSGKKYIDLSDCCYGPIEEIIQKCSGAILEAYGKK